MELQCTPTSLPTVTLQRTTPPTTGDISESQEGRDNAAPDG